MSSSPHGPNDALRYQRLVRGWSLQRVADEICEVCIRQTGKRPGCNGDMIGEWERGVKRPGPFYQERLCLLYGVDADQLDFVDIPVPIPQASSQVPVLALISIALQAQYLGIGVNTMKFDEKKRVFLQRMLAAAGIALVVPPQELLNMVPWQQLSRMVAQPSRVNEDVLSHFAQLNETGWHLSNASQAEVVEQLLPTYLPQVAVLAQQSSAHQKLAAGIATKGYILAAEVDHGNILAMEQYCNLAVLYSQVAEDSNLQVAALKQQATIALVAKKPHDALLVYQKALPLVHRVSPLLRARIYLGLASACARCNPKEYREEALRYLGLAHESFPQHPESDPNFLYTVCGTPVLHLYDGLTHIDLNQPGEAWKALANVDGLAPKMPVPESTRIEIVNLQARAAAEIGDLDRSCSYIEAGIDAATTQGYNLWSSEAFEVFQEIQTIWPNESRVQQLAERFHSVAN